MSKFSLAALLLAMTMLAACDAQRREFKEERAGRLYQEAMADYSAGRMEAAIKGFAKALKSDPANSSARFQLACLQQDSAKDYLAAYCNYREFLQQEPDCDKARLAADRMALCRDQAMRALSLQVKDSAAAVEAKVSAAVQAAKAESDAKLEKSARELKKAEDEVRRLTRENEGLRRMVARIGEEAKPSKMKASDVRSLLDDDEEDGRLQLTEEAKSLFAEEEAADAPGDIASGAHSAVPADDDGPSLLDRRAPGTTEKGARLTDVGRKDRDSKPSDLPPSSRPSEYVVKEGDTLYKIAQEFYGRKSAWRDIRNANKSVISTDGRVKTGQRIVLP